MEAFLLGAVLFTCVSACYCVLMNDRQEYSWDYICVLFGKKETLIRFQNLIHEKYWYPYLLGIFWHISWLRLTIKISPFVDSMNMNLCMNVLEELHELFWTDHLIGENKKCIRMQQMYKLIKWVQRPLNKRETNCSHSIDKSHTFFKSIEIMRSMRILITGKIFTREQRSLKKTGVVTQRWKGFKKRAPDDVTNKLCIICGHFTLFSCLFSFLSKNTR